MARGYIYLVVCTATKRIYVGRSEHQKRPRSHLNALRGGRHHIKLMQHDFDTFGEDSFSFTIIQGGDLSFNYECRTTNEKLRCGRPAYDAESEKEWMVRLRTGDPHFGYNYLDPIFTNHIRDHEKSIEYVSRKYDFPIGLL